MPEMRGLARPIPCRDINHPNKPFLSFSAGWAAKRVLQKHPWGNDP